MAIAIIIILLLIVPAIISSVKHEPEPPEEVGYFRGGDHITDEDLMVMDMLEEDEHK